MGLYYWIAINSLTIDVVQHRSQNVICVAAKDAGHLVQGSEKAPKTGLLDEHGHGCRYVKYATIE